jgi:hypothetical protein
MWCLYIRSVTYGPFRGVSVNLRDVICGTGRCEKIDLAKIKLDAKCIPTARGSLIGNPGETVFSAEITPHLFFNFFTSSRRNVTVTIIHQSIAPSHAVIVPSVTRMVSPGLETRCSVLPHPGLLEWPVQRVRDCLKSIPQHLRFVLDLGL